MATSKHVLEFVANVQNVNQELNAIIDRFKDLTMTIQLKFDVGGGRMVSLNDVQGMLPGMGPGVQGTLPGMSGLVNKTPGVGSIPGVGAPSTPSSPQDQGPWDKLRDSSAFKYLESQKSVREYERQMALTTGGQSPRSFISGKIASLEDNPEMAGTIEAIKKLKQEFHELTKSAKGLREEETKAAGDMDKMSEVTEKMAENSKALNENLKAIQNAGGNSGGGGGGPSFFQRVIGAGGAQILGGIANNLLSNTVDVETSRGAIGNSQLANLRAVTGLSVKDIYTRLDSGIIDEATRAGTYAQYHGPVDIATRGAQAGLLAGRKGAAVLIPGAIKEIGGQMAERRFAETYDQYMHAAGAERGVLIAAGEEAEHRAGMRNPLFSSFGINDSAGFSANARNLTLNSGFSEQDQINVMMGGQRLGGAALSSGRLLRGARSMGMDPNAAMGQAVNLLSADRNGGQSIEAQVDMLARAVARGNDNSELAKRQVDAVIGLSAQIGGFAGASSGRTAEQIMNISSAQLGGAMGTQVGMGVGNILDRERTAKGGLQQLWNGVTSRANVGKFAPGLSEGATNRMIAMLSSVNPDEINDPNFQKMLQAEATAGGYKGTLPFSDMSHFQVSYGEQLRNAGLQQMFGGATNATNQFLAGRYSKGGEAGSAQPVFDGMARGEGRQDNTATGQAMLDARLPQNLALVDVQLGALRDTAQSILGDVGLPGLTAAVKKLGETGSDAMALIGDAIKEAKIEDMARDTSTNLRKAGDAMREMRDYAVDIMDVWRGTRSKDRTRRYDSQGNDISPSPAPLAVPSPTPALGPTKGG